MHVWVFIFIFSSENYINWFVKCRSTQFCLDVLIAFKLNFERNTFLRAPADISLIWEHYSPIPAAGIELSHEALKAAASDNIPVSEDEANLSKQRLKYNIPKFQRFQILRWFVSWNLYIAVYVRHRKEKSEKNTCTKVKKIKRQQFKTFGTLTVF